jgi:hypothetical protein
MEFARNRDEIFDLSRKASDVILSCKNNTQLKGARMYLKLVEARFDTVVCKTEMESGYILKSINNLNKVFQLQHRKLKVQ